jgi:5-hydroxyisourate hydrolase
MALGMKRISTHVLDTMLGKPAAGVPVRLEQREKSGSWLLLGAAQTDQDGRCGQLLRDDSVLSAGIYRLAFETEGYFLAKKIATLYPLVEVTFRVRDGESQFHIPLLLSPNGYTTYRGS